MKGYNKFESLCHPSGNKRGGVGIFYKENLPLMIRSDLSFEECLVIYRSPSVKAGSLQFGDFLDNLENLRTAIKSRRAVCIFY